MNQALSLQELTQNGVTVVVLPEQKCGFLMGAKDFYVLCPEKEKPISEQVQKAFETIQSGAMQPLASHKNTLPTDEWRELFQAFYAVYTDQNEQQKSARTAATVTDAAVGGCCSLALADRPCMGLVDQIQDLDKPAKEITSIQTYQTSGEMSRGAEK